MSATKKEKKFVIDEKLLEPFKFPKFKSYDLLEPKDKTNWKIFKDRYSKLLKTAIELYEELKTEIKSKEELQEKYNKLDTEFTRGLHEEKDIKFQDEKYCKTKYVVVNNVDVDLSDGEESPASKRKKLESLKRLGVTVEDDDVSNSICVPMLGLYETAAGNLYIAIESMEDNVDTDAKTSVELRKTRLRTKTAKTAAELKVRGTIIGTSYPSILVKQDMLNYWLAVYVHLASASSKTFNNLNECIEKCTKMYGGIDCSKMSADTIHIMVDGAKFKTLGSVIMEECTWCPLSEKKLKECHKESAADETKTFYVENIRAGYIS